MDMLLGGLDTQCVGVKAYDLRHWFTYFGWSKSNHWDMNIRMCIVQLRWQQSIGLRIRISTSRMHIASHLERFPLLSRVKTWNFFTENQVKRKPGLRCDKCHYESASMAKSLQKHRKKYVTFIKVQCLPVLCFQTVAQHCTFR